MKRLITVFTFIFVAVMLIAAQVSFSVVAPRRVEKGRRFAVTYRLKNAQGTNFKAPQIPGCTYLYGPSESTSQSTQIVNGQMSSSMSIDFTYYYRADKVGECTIGEASIQVNGKTMKSEPYKFTVVAGNDDESADAQQGNSRNSSRQSGGVNMYDIDTQSSDRSVSGKDIFVRVSLSKASVYEQEAVECVIKLYTKYSISSFRPTKVPEFENFLIEQLDVSPQLNTEESLNGERYMTAVLNKYILYPQKTGKLTINSGNYDVTVVQYEKINMGMFIMNNPREREIKITSNSGTLNVQPLPEPKPAGFQGAVGKFSAESHLVGTNFKSGDPASLVITVKGVGNIKYLNDPEVQFPSQFEVYTPTNNVNAAVAGSNVSGEMTVDYTFVPETPGEFKISPVPYVYFDPATRQYVTIDFPSYDLKVAKGTSRVSSNADAQTDIEAQIKDIRYIDLNAPNTLATNHELVVYKWWFWMIPFAMVVILATLLIVSRKKLKMNADIAGTRLAKASKLAKRRLKEAQSSMKKGQREQFYDDMLRALWGYLSDKLMIPVSQLSRSNITEELLRKGYSDGVASQAVELIDECEIAKYAPESSNAKLDDTYNRGCKLIDQIEKQK